MTQLASSLGDRLQLLIFDDRTTRKAWSASTSKAWCSLDIHCAVLTPTSVSCLLARHLQQKANNSRSCAYRSSKGHKTARKQVGLVDECHLHACLVTTCKQGVQDKQGGLQVAPVSRMLGGRLRGAGSLCCITSCQASLSSTLPVPTSPGVSITPHLTPQPLSCSCRCNAHAKASAEEVLHSRQVYTATTQPRPVRLACRQDKPCNV